MKNILLIDDDDKLGDLLVDYFERFDFRLSTATHPHDGIQRIKEDPPELVILDVMLPDMDGFEVCRAIRKESRIPIVMLTARGEVTDRIVGLELGADDYLPKPFEPRELVVRIQSVLRRVDEKSDEKKSHKLQFKGLDIDTRLRVANLDGSPLDLTTMEYQVLVMFAENSGKTFNRDEILNYLRGTEMEIFSRSVDILISRLRNKLGDTSKNPRFIKTIWGTGYAFIAEEVTQ